jgi:uracil-DNA glycosylase
MKTITPQRVRRSILACTRCTLSSRAGVTPVPYSGPVPATVAVVGEAPGLQENIEGRPFAPSGASGRLLRKTLDDGGIDLDECFICNRVQCYPDGTPTMDEQRACKVHLRRQLELADPKFVLVLGAVALRYFDRDLQVSTCHGHWWMRGPVLIFPTFHPAAALRSPEWHGRFIKDVGHFARLVAAG